MQKTPPKPTLRERAQALKFKLAILKATLKASKKARTGFIYMAYCTIVGTWFLIKWLFINPYIPIILGITLIVYNSIIHFKNKKQIKTNAKMNVK